MSVKSHCPTNCPMGLWLDFVKEADDIRAAGFEHYSARTLGEYIRHHHTKTWKETPYVTNNNHFPAMARAYVVLRRCPDFFEFRARAA